MNRIWMPVSGMGISVRAFLIVGFIGSGVAFGYAGTSAGLFSFPILASGVPRYLRLSGKFFLSREAGADWGGILSANVI